MARCKTISAYLSLEEDADLVEAIERFKAEGGNVSDLIRNLLREYFFGPQIDKADDKTYYKIIQLESKIQDLENYVLEELSKLKQELSVLKQAIEQKLKEKEEEERRKNEEDEEIYKDLLERVYGVVVEMGVDKWIEEKGEHTLRARFERLLPVKAEEMGIKLDYNKAKAVLSKYYPEIAEILFGRREGSRCPRLF